MNDREPYFFLAYAQTPEGVWVDKLYRALSNEILERTNWPTNLPVGFMDRSGIPHGEDWREAVAGALATCRVLVPLYSPRYFTRQQCGFEWHAFNRRLLDHRARRGTDPSPIIPALWTPISIDDVPNSAKHVQADFHQVHPTYAGEGLYTLIKNSAYRTIYQKVVTHLAVQIIRAAEEAAFTSCSINEIDLSRDAFQPAAGDIPPDRRLTIMVAAPTTQRLPGDRAAEVYGLASTAWIPYQQDSRRPIAEAVAYIARSLDFEPDIVSLDEGLNDRDWSGAESGVGVVLFDPWLSLDAYWSEQIRRVDDLSAERIGAVVVWNMRDSQTSSKADEIRKVLQAAAPRVLGDPATPAALGAIRVHSMSEFNALLPTALDRALNQYLSIANASPPPGSSVARPQLYGPETPTPRMRTMLTGGLDGD